MVRSEPGLVVLANPERQIAGSDFSLAGRGEMWRCLKRGILIVFMIVVFCFFLVRRSSIAGFLGLKGEQRRWLDFVGAAGSGGRLLLRSSENIEKLSKFSCSFCPDMSSLPKKFSSSDRRKTRRVKSLKFCQ